MVLRPLPRTVMVVFPSWGLALDKCFLILHWQCNRQTCVCMFLNIAYDCYIHRNICNIYYFETWAEFTLKTNKLPLMCIMSDIAFVLPYRDNYKAQFIISVFWTTVAASYSSIAVFQRLRKQQCHLLSEWAKAICFLCCKSIVALKKVHLGINLHGLVCFTGLWCPPPTLISPIY